MDTDPRFSRLLKQSLIGLAVAASLVTVCYFFVDRPFAFFVHDHEFNQYQILKWLTYAPPWAQNAAPAVFAVLFIRRAFGPFQRWERTVVAAFASLIIADQFRESLSFFFGRYWPETWVNDNPSLIGNDEYGFHPFHSGSAYGSFPSGHSARTMAVVSVAWIAYPRLGWICGLVFLAEAIGLLGMNYHFVGDVIGGGFVGGLVGVYTAYCCNLDLPGQPRGSG